MFNPFLKIYYLAMGPGSSMKGLLLYEQNAKKEAINCT